MKPLKKIINLHEETTYRELQNIAQEYGYDVHIKIGIKDVLPIEGSGLNNELYSFALKAHFDFTICDNTHCPLFAVEFDGPSHADRKQVERDKKKDELCKRFSFPILRINTNHLLKKYNKSSLLRWIMSAWELQKAFHEAQENGHIPLEEDFDPISLWHHGKTIEERHPHWIALKPRLEIKKLHERGKTKQGHTCGFTFYDKNDNHRGIEWIDVAENKVVFVESSMRSQQFPIYLSDLFNELMTVLLYEKLMNYLKTKLGSAEPLEVEERLNKLKARYSFAGAHTGPTCVKASISWDKEIKRWV